MRLAPPRGLHDGLIAVDHTSVWVLTQSLNAFAARAPASIVRVEGEATTLKLAAYVRDNLRAGVSEERPASLVSQLALARLLVE